MMKPPRFAEGQNALPHVFSSRFPASSLPLPSQSPAVVLSVLFPLRVVLLRPPTSVVSLPFVRST